ncbi:MAG: enoyl-CoA hydratase/isomerase, partial [Deltaproteobacteria bacterium]|nr:enoyl-CoA hydratase/isomerase [Deltaproteobacteria bacterium]
MAELKFINANIDENAGIAWLTLSRPEKKNALSIALLAEISSTLRSLAENDKIRCIVTTGAGDSYSSGRDLYDMRGQDNRRRTRGFGGVAEIVDIMRKLPQVTVAKVRGWCLGGGLAMINGHDLVISADTAKFGMPEVIRGSYGATATPSLFHAGIPFKKAFFISLTGRNLTGVEAERVGLVSDVVPEKELDSYVETFMRHGGSFITLAKGNRSRAVTEACKKHRGFYLGSIGGPAAILAKENIKKVELLEYPELGMEAVYKIEVEDFPAFILVDDKGND